MAHFGERYRDDYADGGLSRPAEQRLAEASMAGQRLALEGLDGVGCVHGHFLPLKYLPLAEREPLIFVTWMRDPVARLISHYDYWQRSYDSQHSMPHHRRVIEEGWTLEQFCLSEAFRNVYSQYLRGFPLERFAFIGISEFYRDDLHAFSERFLAGELQYRQENMAERPAVGERMTAEAQARIRTFHAEDARLYEYALALRKVRRR